MLASTKDSGRAFTKHNYAFLPLVVFPVLTVLSIKLIVAHLLTFEPALRAQCSPGSTSASNIPYTGIHALDSQLCFMVAFFHSALDHPFASDFLVYFVGSSSIYVIFPCLEAIRLSKAQARSVWAKMLGYPEAWLALSQVASLGVTMTLYGLVLVLAPVSAQEPTIVEGSTNAKEDRDVQLEDSRQISTIDMNTVVMATALGAAVPSLALFVYRDPSITVLWQAFPLYVFFARLGYRRLFANSPTQAARKEAPSLGIVDGFKSVQRVLLSSAVLSTYFHISFLYSLARHHDLAALLGRSRSLETNDSLAFDVLVFLLWDFMFTSLSALLALGFDAISAGGGSIMVIVACILGCVVVGPGAVVPLCVLRREERLASRKIRDGSQQ